MKDHTTSYIPLIEAWENFQQAGHGQDLRDFGAWLIKSSKDASNQPIELEEYFSKNSMAYDFQIEGGEAAFLIWRLNKFLRHYVKPVLTEQGLASQDDFAILAQIDIFKTCSKKEAVETNIIEPTTGIEIIKRLIKQDLVKEEENPEDKRQKLVSLTEKGKAVLMDIYIGFSKIQDVLVDMPSQERKDLIATLKSLDTFHTQNLKAGK
jgi:DNA-binding MarR family transcriptional regulator